MANIQVDYFYNKVEKLIEKLTSQVNEPLKYLKTALHRWGRADTIPILDIQPVGIEQVVKIIKDMHSSHAFGHDGIDVSSLKIVADSVAVPIVHR